MAMQSVVTQLFVDGAWTTYPAYSAEGWSSQIGPDLNSGTQPSKTTFTLQNPDLSMDPSNVLSPLYGKIGRNTPARLQVDGTNVGWVEASEWTPERTQEHDPAGWPGGGGPKGRAKTDILGEGLLRRLSKWDDPIQSPMRRQISSYASLLGYWPLEDPTGVERLTQVVKGAQPGRFIGTVNLAANDGPGGSDTTPELGTGGALLGSFLPVVVGGWQFMWTFKADVAPLGVTFLPIMRWTDTAARQWTWQVNGTNFLFTCTAADGTLLVNSTVSYGSTRITDWIRYRVKVTVSGGTVSVELAWYPQDGSFILGTTVTFASTTTGRIAAWRAEQNANTDGGSYGHVFAVSDTALDLTGSYDAVAAFNGYLGETAGARFVRILGENGITRILVGAASATMPMGRQKPAKLLDIVEECARTDAALLYDSPASLSIVMRARVDRVNQTSKLDLTYNVNVSVGLVKEISDAGIVNDITSKNADGTESNSFLAAGRLSVQAPPAGIGRVRGSLAVNTQRADYLDQRTDFELSRSTIDRPRYVQLVIDLFANPGLKAACTSLRPGDLVTVAGLYGEPTPVQLHAMTITHAGGHATRTCTLACVPGELFQVGIYDNAGTRYDSASTTLASGITTTAVSVPITTALNGDQAATSGFPYTWVVNGEQMTVTAMTAPAGTGPWTQTATVTRSVNGAVRSHLAGTEVHLANPKRYGL